MLKKCIRCVAIFTLFQVFPTPTLALEFGTDGGIEGHFDTTLSWGAAWRVQDRSAGLIGIANGGTAYSVNGDDGDLNYSKGLISNAIKATHDLDIRYRNFGAFFRASYFYDHYNENKDVLSPEAKDKVGKDADILDAYLRGSFDVNGRALDIRVGKQVVSWGESTFIQNSINVINPVDVSKLRVPGAELREALLPIPMIWASHQLSDNISFEALYITGFDHTEIDPRGTYFSTNDFASDGGQYVVTGFGLIDDDACGTASPFSAFCVPRAPDRKAKDRGQYGAALRWLAPELNDTEFGFYYMNYHSRLPLISAIAASNPTQTPSAANTAQYFVEYPEDIHMFGVSFNTVLPDSGIALQGEYSYRSNVPLQVEDVEILFSALCSAASQLGACPAGPGGEISGYRRHEVGQLQFTATKIIGAENPFKASQWVLLGEVGISHVYDLPSKGVLRYEGPATYLPGNPAVAGSLGLPTQNGGYADATSWGYRIVTRLDYNSVWGAVNLSPRLAFAHDVHGTSPGPGGNFIEGRKAITLGLGATYLGQWSGDLSYTAYTGGGDFNQVHDRDFVALNVKYSF